MSGIEMFQKGGFIMYPLFIFSVLAWSVGTYKIFQVLGFAREYKKTCAELKTAVMTNKSADVASIAKNGNALVSGPLEAINAKSSREVLHERVGRKLAETNGHLKEYLWILGTIAASAPFVGLFGTVVGIMSSFEAIGTTGKSGFSVVAAGISESLVATAAGIIVAVVALLFYNYLQSRVNTFALDFRIKAEELIDLVTSTDGR
jgi:biopolymer transport protein ExbB/TolQ